MLQDGESQSSGSEIQSSGNGTQPCSSGIQPSGSGGSGNKSRKLKQGKNEATNDLLEQMIPLVMR